MFGPKVDCLVDNYRGNATTVYSDVALTPMYPPRRAESLRLDRGQWSELHPQPTRGFR